MTSKKSKTSDDTKKRVLVNYAGEVLIAENYFALALIGEVVIT